MNLRMNAHIETLVRDIAPEYGGTSEDLQATLRRVLNDRPHPKPDLLEKALTAAREILLEVSKDKARFPIRNPDATREYLRVWLRKYDREVFVVMYLNIECEVIVTEVPFYGSAHDAVVYPSEIVKRCLELNASKVIFAHNHPSGNPEPSGADMKTTVDLVQALRWINVDVLDHIVVGERKTVSMLERGQL